MLASITPLGERSRKQRWGITTFWYLIGASLGGVAIGGVLGALGMTAFRIVARPSGTLLVWFFVCAAAVGLLFELGIGRIALPTTDRQVDDAWLYDFRGWVYGLGFGLQLGVGIATVVTTSAVYLSLIAAVLTGSPLDGALIGLVFGAVRGIVQLAARRITDPARLIELSRNLDRWDGFSRKGVILVEIGVALVAMATLV